jgi:acetylornithine deacetylase
MVAAKKARSLELAGDVIVAAVADEEVASFGTSAVIERFRADAAIVTEPTELRLCLAHKGFVWLEVETGGVAAHGSRPQEGVDAISRMGRILTALVNLDRMLRLGAGHRLLGRGSVHGSLIEGGQEWSTYPARCAVKVERRTIPGEDGARALKEMEALIEIAREETANLVASAKVVLERASSELAADHPVALAVAQAAREALGGDAEAIGVAYWMDMALTNAAGIPTVAFGPTGEGEHAVVEWVDVASLETCVEVYVLAAKSLCGKPA